MGQLISALVFVTFSLAGSLWVSDAVLPRISVARAAADAPAAAQTIPLTAPVMVEPVRSPLPEEPAPAPSLPKARGADAVPVRVSIPSVSLDTRVIPVGMNAKGEMDVPDGATSDVGWYKRGTVPGQIGSAVLDAHVYAAFEDLRYAKVGDEILVTNAGGEVLRFRIEDSRVYSLSELTPTMLFGRSDVRRLNLITCAGTFRSSINTYDHRLVVYAVFEDIVSS